MSGSILVITAIIVIAIYIYMRHTFKKRRRAVDEIDTVQYYRENYLKSGPNNKRSGKINQTDGYRTYVTKYNSTEDYRERKGL